MKKQEPPSTSKKRTEAFGQQILQTPSSSSPLDIEKIVQEHVSNFSYLIFVIFTIFKVKKALNEAVLPAIQGKKKRTSFQKRAMLIPKKRKLVERPESSTSEDSFSESEDEDDKVMIFII